MVHARRSASLTPPPTPYFPFTEEQIDLSKIDLNKQRVKVLKKILNDQFNDGCKGCLEKEDYIKRINELHKTEL